MQCLTSELASVKEVIFVPSGRQKSFKTAWFQPICRQQCLSSLLHVSRSPLDKRALCNEGANTASAVTSVGWEFDLVPFLLSLATPISGLPLKQVCTCLSSKLSSPGFDMKWEIATSSDGLGRVPSLVLQTGVTRKDLGIKAANTPA